MEQWSESLIAAANWVGSGLCHQWDSHSYIINGVPLCLCARCTGMYLGTLLTLVYLVVRTRGLVQMPRPPYLLAFLVFFALWAADGVNSYLTTLRGAPFLYPPQNLIRLTTGMLMGIVLGSLVYVILNLLVNPVPRGTAIPPLYASARDLALLMALGAVAVMLIETRADWLLYPLTVILVIAMLIVNTVFWIGITGALSAQPTQPAVLRRNILIAFAMTIFVLNAMALARVYLGLSFEPPI